MWTNEDLSKVIVAQQKLLWERAVVQLGHYARANLVGPDGKWKAGAPSVQFPLAGKKVPLAL